MPKKKIIIVNFIILFLFLFLIAIIDILYSNFIYSKKIIDEIRVLDDNYHHGLKKNFDTNKAHWGERKYRICTNNLGLKIKCGSLNKNKYEIAFMGDSFTEGIGMSYEDSFVGLIEQSYNTSVINLGVSSYSPVIYYFKVKHMIEKKKLSFNHLVLFLDISDIPDELIWKNCQNHVCENLFLGSNIFLIKFKKFIKDNLRLSYRIIYYLKSKFNSSPNRFEITGVGPYDYEYPTSSWTYDLDYKLIQNANIDNGIDLALRHTEMLYNLLKKNNITLSIAVYPHPASLLHDTRNSRQVKIWENFCYNKCHTFINYFELFFDFQKDQAIKEYYIKNDIHFNKQGNKFIALNFPIEKFN